MGFIELVTQKTFYGFSFKDQNNVLNSWWLFTEKTLLYLIIGLVYS